MWSHLRSRTKTNQTTPYVGRNLRIRFIVVQNLDDSVQFILGREFVKNINLTIDRNTGLSRVRNPDRIYVKKPKIRILTDENEITIFLDRKIKLKPKQAVIATFRKRNLNASSEKKTVCLILNPNSQNADC